MYRQAGETTVPATGITSLVYAHQPVPVWGPGLMIQDDYVWKDARVADKLRVAAKAIDDAHPGLAVDAATVIGSPGAVLVAESAHARGVAAKPSGIGHANNWRIGSASTKRIGRSPGPGIVVVSRLMPMPW